MGAMRKNYVALEAHKAVLDVLECTKISARFPRGPGDRTLIVSTKKIAIKGFFIKN